MDEVQELLPHQKEQGDIRKGESRVQQPAKNGSGKQLPLELLLHNRKNQGRKVKIFKPEHPGSNPSPPYLLRKHSIKLTIQCLEMQMKIKEDINTNLLDLLEWNLRDCHSVRRFMLKFCNFSSEEEDQETKVFTLLYRNNPFRIL